MRLRRLLLLIAPAASFPGIAAPAERPVVVELFTSRGCSSCPPANAYLNELSKRPSDVLALAFHVTYWDYLGWKDPFSLKIATDRQERYGRLFGHGSYTPEIVVDGSTGMVGSYRDDVDHAIANARMNGTSIANVHVVVKNGEVSIDVGADQGTARVLLVGFDRERVTPIGRGETWAVPRSKQTSFVRFDWLPNGVVHRSTSTNGCRKASSSRSSSKLRMGILSARPGPSALDQQWRKDGSFSADLIVRTAV